MRKKIAVKIVIDSFAWIEIFRGSQKGRQAFSSVEEADLVSTPETVLAEVARKYLREGVKENVVRSRLRTITQSSEVSQIDEQCAVESGRVYFEIEDRAKKSKLDKPSLFDAVVLATQGSTKARF